MKMIKFSNLANKVNIEKFKQQKKLNKNNINNEVQQNFKKSEGSFKNLFFIY